MKGFMPVFISALADEGIDSEFITERPEENKVEIVYDDVVATVSSEDTDDDSGFEKVSVNIKNDATELEINLSFFTRPSSYEEAAIAVFEQINFAE